MKKKSLYVYTAGIALAFVIAVFYGSEIAGHKLSKSNEKILKTTVHIQH